MSQVLIKRYITTSRRLISSAAGSLRRRGAAARPKLAAISSPYSLNFDTTRSFINPYTCDVASLIYSLLSAAELNLKLN